MVLQYAILVAIIQTLNLLEKHCVNIDLIDNEGWTLLHLAMLGRTSDVYEIFLVNRVDKTMKNNDENMPFDVIISFGK